MKILLQQVRYDKNLSLRQLEIRTGMPRSTLNDFENGHSIPRMDHMELLAKALRVRISDLYESDYK